MNSPHNASGYYTIYGEESLQANHFNTKLSFGDPQTLWARTGYLGFVKRTDLLDASGGKDKAVNNSGTFRKGGAPHYKVLSTPFFFYTFSSKNACVLPALSSSDRHDALFVVGSLDETLELRGLRYHPIDIETSVSRAHRSIAER